MWGWKHSLKGVSNTEFIPPIITLPFYPSYSTEYPVGTYNTDWNPGDNYWFSGGKFIPEYDADYFSATEQ